jgi:hypothetical protein
MTSRQTTLFRLILLLAALAPPLSAQVREGSELVMLDPKVLVNEVAINATVATTITFPSKIVLLTGFGLATEPAAAKQMETGRVAIVHYENVLPDTLVVRLVKPGEPCHVTVRTARHIHLLRFVPSEEANLAVIVQPPVQKDAAVAVQASDVVAGRIKFSTDELVGMLGKARNRKALQPLNPGLYHSWQERNNLDMAASTNGQLASIYEIQRNPEKDLMVFRCWLTNTTDKAYEFEPSSVKVRVGERSYDPQLVDGADVIPPGQKVPLDVVLQGGPTGGREGLSINQDFRVELPEPGRRQIDPALFGDASFAGGK